MEARIRQIMAGNTKAARGRIIPRWAAALWFLATLLCAALPAWGESGETFFFTDSGTQEADGDRWTYPIALDILRDAEDVLRLVNRDNTLDSGYPPETAPYAMRSIKLRKADPNLDLFGREVAVDALEALFAAATEDGRTLVLESAYRSYGQQAANYERRLKRLGEDDGYVQPPGASEHQMGLAFDVINPAWVKEPRLHERFAQTEEGVWLKENCHRFGFIIRYPKEKEEITGIHYEPWHLRYVGVEAAAYIMENDLSLEEFTAQWRHQVAEYAVRINDPGVLSGMR